MKKNKINIAFVGGGNNSAVGIAHHSAINMDNRYNLVAGCFSRNKDINMTTAKQYSVSDARVYDSIDNLIINEKNKIDAIVILTPTNQHFKQVLKCIDSNIPIICEKALGQSLLEINEIKNKIKKNNSFLAIIYNYIGYPMIKFLKNYIDNNEIGKINHIQIEMPQESFLKVSSNLDPVIPQDWRLEDDVIPTLSLDLGVHLHLMINYLTNQHPIEVVSHFNTFGNFNNIVDNVSSIIKYSNDIVCNMWYSKIAIGERNGLKIRIYGEKGSAEWIQENPDVLFLANNLGSKWTIDRGSNELLLPQILRYERFKAGHPIGFVEAFANYYMDVADSLERFKNKNEIEFIECFGVEQALEGIKLLEAMQLSVKEGSWIKI